MTSLTKSALVALAISAGQVLAPATFLSSTLSVSPSLAATVQTGTASWYGPGLQGNPTANGETFNMHELTAAHRSLPFGTRVKVTNNHNGKSVIVRINDRGPFVGGRIIDLSRAAAEEISMIGRGTATVTLEILG